MRSAPGWSVLPNSAACATGNSRGARWVLDVTYLLVAALTVDDRAAHERDMLARYPARLTATVVDAPSFDHAWLRNRQNVGYGVLLVITP